MLKNSLKICLMKDYQKFLEKKQLVVHPSGFETKLEWCPYLFQWQRDIVNWALIRGKACLFEDCGLGKTIQQLEWARHVQFHTQKPVLIIAPLGVVEQTCKKESIKFEIYVKQCNSGADVIEGINITNYEKLHLFDTSVFGGVVLDESSILKNFSGHYSSSIIDLFKETPYKLACTATPAPNDYMELGTHAEFVGAMTRTEMLSMFFINDMGDTGEWRLKKHAKERDFWKWVCSWAITLTSPSDLGYDGAAFQLPELRYHEVKVPYTGKNTIGFFTQEAKTMDERRQVRKESIQARCDMVASIVEQQPTEQWLLWVGLNAEAVEIHKRLSNVAEVAGDTEHMKRVSNMIGFSNGEIPILMTKPKIAGFGMNWQNCGKMAFVGLSDSWESLYQAVRRCYRFGRTEPVDVYIVIEEREGKVLQNIKRKDAQARHMIKSMVEHTKEIIKVELNNKKIESICQKEKMRIPTWLS